MGTLLAIKKGEHICLGADSSSTREPQLDHANSRPPSCIIEFQNNLIGLHSSIAYQQAFESALKYLGRTEELPAQSISDVHTLFTSIHETLRSHFYLQSSTNSTAEFELSPMGAILVNASGIYRIDAQRGVYYHEFYCALGTGYALAVGATAALIDSKRTAVGIVDAALKICADLDPESGKTQHIKTINLASLAQHKAESRKAKKNSSLKLLQ